MKLNSSMMIELAGAILLTVAIAWGLIILLRPKKKTAAEIERIRRLEVNHRGRIVPGQIVELIEPEPAKPGPRLVVYKYEVAGVTYEAAQDVTALPDVISLLRRSPALLVSVKYYPGKPTNSIVACEEWSGVPYDEPSTPVKRPLAPQAKLEAESKTK